MKQPFSIATGEALEVRRDLTGGARVTLGARSFVLSPEQAVKFAAAVMAAVGGNVTIENAAPLPARDMFGVV